MRSTASLVVAAFLALIVSDARAQEASISLNVETANEQLQRTPALVIHEVLTLPAVVKNAPLAALKTPGAPTKNAASKLSAAGAPSVAPSSQPIVFPTVSTSESGEMGTTGNPKYDALIALSAARNGVDPNLIIAVMRQESGFNLRARSYKGASGLMQLMPATAQRFGVTNIYDPAQNIEGGTRYLRFLMEWFKGDISLVLAGYNAGENAVVRFGYQIPRYRETQNYVRSITARYDSAKNRTAGARRVTGPAAPSAETFSNGRLSNNY
ncbi:MAG: lytic transglycosylase domain-containing protein [Acidobacteriota bacterium]